MQRDMQLIRELLLRCERGEKAPPEGYSDEEIAYNVQLMLDAQLIDGTVAWGAVRGTRVPQRWFITRMTWHGHEFLDSARDETIWNRAKEKVMKPAASWTFAILMEWLKQEIKQKMGGIG